MVVLLEGLGFNLCVAPFLNTCVPNLPQGWGQRLVRGCQSLVGGCWSLVGGCLSLVRGCWSLVGGAILEMGKKRLSQGRQWGQGLVRINKVTKDIQTSKEYRRWLLFKRLYAAGFVWFSQGLGTKALGWNRETRNGVGNFMWRTRGSWWHGNGYQWNRDAGMKDETRGTGMNGGVSEMWWKWNGLEVGKV